MGPAEVRPRRRRADEEAPGDLVVGQPLADEGHHLALPVRELLQAAIGPWLLRMRRELLDKSPGDGRREQGLAESDHPDRLEELLGLRVLDQEAAGAGADRLEHVLVDVEGGDDHHSHAGEAVVPGGRGPGGSALAAASYLLRRSRSARVRCPTPPSASLSVSFGRAIAAADHRD
jgi:hypothetical protein